MISLERLAANIGKRSKKVLNINEDQEQVVVYGAIMLLNTSISILSVMFFGFLVGAFYESLLFSIVVSILRKYSGGVHASSPGRCIVIGTITAVVLGFAIDNFLYSFSSISVIILSIISIIVAFIIIYKKAPVDSIKKPITDNNLRKKFKNYSIKIIIISLLIEIILFLLYKNYLDIIYIKVIECMSLGIIYQSLTLTGVGIRILNKVDFVLKYIFGRDGKNER